MSSKQFRLMLTLTVLAAFAGGAISSRILTAEAQKTAPRSNVVIVPAGGLTFKTPEGHIVARLDATPDGARFGLYGKAGEGAAIIGAGPDGGGFAIYDQQGKAMGSMAATPKGGALGLFNKDEKILWEAP